jgi:ABC-type Mn2+/Zn2+ transport system permease subunit
VIESFVASWELFQHTWLAGWSIAALLSLLGVFVVARDQIFIGAAVAQASTLGVAVALWLGGLAALGSEWFEGDALRSGFAVGFALLATLVTSRGGGRQASHEAITGWVFLLAAGGATLLLAHSPHGTEEIHRLLASTLIGATRGDVLLFGGMTAATVAIVAAWSRPLLLLSVDPPMAAAVGLRAGLWNALSAIWLGVAVGLSIRVSGMLYVFGCLVLPSLVARSLARELRGLLVLAPALALAASGAGFVFAHAGDYPPAQVTVVLLAGAVAVTWTGGWLREQTGG